MQQVLQIVQVNARKQFGGRVTLLSEDLSQLLKLVSDVLLLGYQIVLGCRVGRCLGGLGIIVAHAHLALQIAGQVAVFSLRAEAGDKDHLDKVSCKAQSPYLCLVLEDLGSLSVSVLSDDRAHNLDQVLEAIVFNKVNKPLRLQVFESFLR